jgi:hypothetical protein
MIGKYFVLVGLFDELNDYLILNFINLLEHPMKSSNDDRKHL